MRRRIARPFGSSITAARAFSLILLLGVLWMLYNSISRPETWKWFADDQPQAALITTTPVDPNYKPILIDGVTDLDEQEITEFDSKKSLITDRTPLRGHEMDTYWQFMVWSCAQPFSEMHARAQPEPAVSALWEKPGSYRGKLINLRLHVRRVLKYDAPANPVGLKDIYEVWGWSDLSRSFPYVVVVPELPPGFPVGNEVEVDADFSGYFLKIMAYAAYDKNRGAPLMIGRLHASGLGSGSRENVSEALDETWFYIVAGITLLLVGGYMWSRWQSKPPRRTLSNSTVDLNWMQEGSNPSKPTGNEGPNDPFQFDIKE
jgi:hypothetical protein